jgi:sugar phosphate isomerase/epimerase
MRALLLSDDGNVEAVAALCRTHGCGIEMQAFYDPEVYFQEPDVLRRHLTQAEGITLRSIHACYGDLCPGSFDRMVREVARNRYELSYSAAVGVCASHMVVHHGYVPHTSPPDRWVRRARQFWQDFLEGKPSSVHLLMENMLDWDPSVLIELVDSIGSPLIDINLDLGHAHCDSRTDVVQWISLLGSRIGYVHMHDNHGQEIERLPLGMGSVPLREACVALEELSPRALWVVETENQGIQESLEWLQRNGFWRAG